MNELTDTIEKIIGEEGAPGNPAVLAQIEIPAEDPPKNNQEEPASEPKKKSNYKGRPKGAKNKKKSEPKRDVVTESMEWRDVATKEALPMVEAPSAPPEPLPVPAEQEDDDLDERDPFDGMSQREIREIKADSYADLAEQAILVVGGMFDAPEKKLALKPRERKALRKAILPVIPEDTGADPWGSLVILGIMLLAPRAAVIYTAREEQIAKAQAESLLTGQNALETAECHAAA